MAASGAVDLVNEGVVAVALHKSPTNPITLPNTVMKPEITRTVANKMPVSKNTKILRSSQVQEASGQSTALTLVSQVQLQWHSLFGVATSRSQSHAENQAMATANQLGSSLIGGPLNLERQPAAPH